MILTCLASLQLYALDKSRILGEVHSRTGNPLQNVRIVLEGKSNTIYRMVSSDHTGTFLLGAVPAGHYRIQILGNGYKSFNQEDLALEPAQTLWMKVIFSKEDDLLLSEVEIIRTEYTEITYQTILNPNQIHRYPSAHNVWSLVENQDLSATTNRIDVGGLWSAIPALFSSRGSVSWTQTEYYLNGMDVGDPYSTGKPLFYPDFYSLQYTQMTNAGHPIQTLGPGGAFNLITRKGRDEFHGGASFFFLNSGLQSENVSSALNDEGIFESHRFNNFFDGNINLSGPVIPEKLNFFASVTGFRINRDMAEFEDEDLSSVLSGLFNLSARLGEGELNLLWTGQRINHDSYGAEREVPYSSTTERRESYNVLQAVYDTAVSGRHFFKFGLSLTQGSTRSNFQPGDESHGYEIFTEIPSGLAAQARGDTRTNLNFLASGESILTGETRPSHILSYGFQIKYAHATSDMEVAHNQHRIFFIDEPIQVALFNTPSRHQESALHIDGFIKDSMIFKNFFSVYLGLHLSYSRGWAPGLPPDSNYQGISWFNLSPRVGLTFPLNRDKSSAIRIHAARYYLTMPLNYLTYGHPNSPGALVYQWNDLNNDLLYQENEAGALLRREGPFYGGINPEIKRPLVDEIAVSWQKTFKSGWALMFGLFTRETRNLIESLNIGVPFESYNPVSISDIGDDRILGTHDDLTFTVYDQDEDTLGQDVHYLTNEVGENRISKYYGADLTLLKRYGDKFTFFLSLTATQADGTTNPGNSEWENDHGVIGSLYDDPNSLINARGRMRFDRAYTGRLGIQYRAPHGITLGCIIKYYDGQPFTRKIIVTGLTQGPFYIQAHPRGVARYEYNRTIEIRIEKAFTFGEGKTLRLILDGFNIINRALATEENEWTSPVFPLRYATEIQSPRVFRLGLAYEF